MNNNYFTEFEAENYHLIYSKYKQRKKQLTLKSCSQLLLKRAGIQKKITFIVTISFCNSNFKLFQQALEFGSCKEEILDENGFCFLLKKAASI